MAYKPLVKAKADAVASDLQRRLIRARREAARKVMEIQDRAKLATHAAERERLYGEVSAIYRELASGADKMLRSGIDEAAKTGHARAVEEIRDKGGRVRASVAKFSETRARSYLSLITPENSTSLVATFTDKMATEDVRALRVAFLDTFRQSQLEGWTAREIHKRLQGTWDSIARNMEGNRFIDSAGRQWANADYLSMLTRTTMSRVARESSVDTLVSNGDELGIIQSSGENCPICDAWAGLVVSLTGAFKNFPSLRDAYAAGWGHPNCDCSVEGYVEAVDIREAQRQGSIDNPPDWTDREAVQAYNDDARIAAMRAKGMSMDDADIALKREKLSHRMDVALLGDKKDIVSQIPPDVLARIPQSKLPRFELAKKGEPALWNRSGARGGVVHVSRDASGEAILGQLTALFGKSAPVAVAGSVVAGQKALTPEAQKRAEFKEKAKAEGFDIADQIDKIPDSVINKIGEFPKISYGSQAHCKSIPPHEIVMAKNGWHGNQMNFTHELGHSVHFKTGHVSYAGAVPELKAAIEADYKTWKAAAKKAKGKDWARYYSPSNQILYKNDFVKNLGLAENYEKLAIDVRIRIVGFTDTIGGLSKGKYGCGHAISYYKRSGGIPAQMEVYANIFRAIVNNWTEYEREFPLTTQWIRTKLEL